MARARSAILLVTTLAASLVVLAACGRDLFLDGGGGLTGTPTPTGTSTTPAGSPTPSPESSRFPTPGPTPALGFGNGTDSGVSSISAATVINVCAAVAWASNGTIAFESSPPAAGVFPPASHAFLLWQVQSATTSSAGGPAAFTDVNGAGLWEIVRITSISGVAKTATLANAMLYRYRSVGDDRAQVCHVPEYMNFAVNSGASARAAPWDGHTGGVVALFASGNLDLNNVTGSIEASGAGFRGGTPGEYDGPVSLSRTAVDTLVTTTGGSKGESLDGRSLVHHGTGAIANGGGGGNDDCGGGAGGSNGGLAGRGGIGFTAADTFTAGVGAAAVVGTNAAPVRLLLGGGGGGGATHHVTTAVGAGGAGGGVALLIANGFQNGGGINADGAAGKLNPTDGAGGGGAGGAIVIYSGSGNDIIGTFNARGGVGGKGGSSCGSGGGGAGGQIRVTGAVGSSGGGGHCIINGGAAGTGSGSRAGIAGASGARSATSGTCPP